MLGEPGDKVRDSFPLGPPEGGGGGIGPPLMPMGGGGGGVPLLWLQTKQYEPGYQAEGVEVAAAEGAYHQAMVLFLLFFGGTLANPQDFSFGLSNFLFPRSCGGSSSSVTGLFVQGLQFYP